MGRLINDREYDAIPRFVANKIDSEKLMNPRINITSNYDIAHMKTNINIEITGDVSQEQIFIEFQKALSNNMPKNVGRI